VLDVLLASSLLVVGAALWVAGLRLFVRADLTKPSTVGWSGVLSYFGSRACGFEVGTVFAVAAAARHGLDILGVSALVERLR
jgi:hypothetical protein